jgi:2-amino-4-hydroxy-6-hydroxymethyldihydropteridine diphosphokinase
MATCHIGLGSNLENRRANLVAALELIGRLPGTQVRRVSQFIETSPVGGPSGQQPFLNAAAVLETMLLPRLILERLREIEQRLGRAHRERWGPRSIDLDILLWGEERIDEPGLTIPHPAMHFRRFVLEPLVEIAPEARHPSGWTVAERWQGLNRWPHYLAITGPMGAGKTTLSRELAARLRADLVEEQFDSLRLGRLFGGDHTEGGPVQDYFLSSRSELLNPARLGTTLPAWMVSDFWFAQSLAYAEVLLEPPAREQHRLEVNRAAAKVVDPTLVVWLDAPLAELETRIQKRGRDFEAPVSGKFLAELQAGYARVLTAPSAPPLYRPQTKTLEELTAELLTVAAAISG